MLKRSTATDFSPRYRRWVLLLALLASAFGYIDRVIVQTLGQAIKEDLLLSDFQLGIMSGLGFALLYSTLGLPIARLAERASRVRIVGVSIAAFSVMAALCGTATTFAQMLLYRIGVGIGEAGVQSPTASLLGDHFPPSERGKAMSVMKLGSPVGSVFGAIIGGWIAHNHGWRAALIALALPGIVVAFLYLTTLREPPRGLQDGEIRGPATPIPSMRTAFGIMAAKPGFWNMLVGLGLASMALYGTGAFATPFFMRVYHLDLATAGLYFAALSGISATIGMLAGGLVIDRIGTRGPQMFGYLPAAGLALAVPIFVAGYSVPHPVASLALQTLGATCLLLHNVPTLVAFQNMVNSRMRATAAFVFFFVSTIVGIGFGPMLLGFLSDKFATAHAGGLVLSINCPGGKAAAGAAFDIRQACDAAGAHGVRMALISMGAVMAWSAFHYALAGRSLTRAAAGRD